MNIVSTTSLAPKTPKKGRRSGSNAWNCSPQYVDNLDMYATSFNKLIDDLCTDKNSHETGSKDGGNEGKVTPLLTYIRKNKALISSVSDTSDAGNCRKRLTLPITRTYVRRSRLARNRPQTSAAETFDPCSSIAVVKKTRKRRKSCTKAALKRAPASIDDAKEENHDEEWLEDERELFRRRAQWFITRMREFLGARCFSKWNGSVVDAVVGAFLTQNVADHLSSSAYMSLGASFHLQPRRKYYTRQSAKRTKKLNTRTGKKKIDWEKVRKEVLANAPCKRKSDTIDSFNWEMVREARADEISEAIKERGMNNRLAERIKGFLDHLVDKHGSIDLEWLRYLPADIAKEFLGDINGIGPKSVDCISLLTLHNIAFPVDTNVARICVRLGWVPLQPLPESLQLHLLEQYPLIRNIQKYLWPRLCTLDQQTLYELHYQMITFGKVICTKSKPNCNSCPMRPECKHFASAFASSRLALPEQEENRLSPLQLAGPTTNISEPLIEEPKTPERECRQFLERDMEDFFNEDSEEIRTINICLGKFRDSIKNPIQSNMDINDDDMSRALDAIPEYACIPIPQLKSVNRLRTEHLVWTHL